MEFKPLEINERLPYLLRRENIARYEGGKVIIGDRRAYPFERLHVTCDSVEQVAEAIRTMVTQGGGSWVAASYALAMLASQERRKPKERLRQILNEATERLKGTRPTSNHLHRLVERALKAGLLALENGEDVEAGILAWLEAKRDDIHIRSARMGQYGADMIPDGAGILTMCFAETAFLLGLVFARDQGKTLRVYVPETRPYLQGARLTAPSIHELGIEAVLITDNMPGYVVSEGKVQVFFTGADLVTLDGHVVNKVGTYQNALVCRQHGVPFFPYCWEPDHKHPGRESIFIEERDPADVRQARGAATTLEEIQAYYPAFDITPPQFVSGVITLHGIISPYDLARYFGEGVIADA
ncbi:MAG: S-methyl-5-thioribose-1-phosphate isomerase [Chloroflexi bacterium]|nr:S-methyl-5-thioribose-1-phosphate isomerase [Chloroflexota bacterium]